MKSHNRYFKSKFVLLACIILFCFVIPKGASAQNGQPDQVTVLFILDDSGSMLGSDPANLRYTAAKLFIASLDEGDEIGAIRFSTQSRPILEGLVPITNSKVKGDLIDALSPVKADGFTDVKAAFSDAEVLVKGVKTTSRKTIVILLTDGKPEIPQPYAGYEDETLAIAKRLGVPVYAIALTYEGQSAFLNRVASQTGGKVIPAKSANDLLDSYLQILGDLKDRTVVGDGVVHSPSEITVKLEPALMPYVSKVTFIVSQEPAVKVKLIGPDKKEVQPTDPMVTFSMISDPGFTAFTITNPASGDWKFNLSGNGSAQVRAILHSRLRTRIVSPVGLMEAGQPMRIVVNLIEEQADGSIVKVVGDASFSAMVTLPDSTRQSLDTFYDDGTHSDQVAGDGNFSREFVETIQPGPYKISVRGLKGVVPVTTSTQVESIPFPKIVIDQPLNQKYEIRSNTIPLKIHLEGAALSAFEGDFKAIVTSPTGKNFEIALKFGNGSYAGELAPVEAGAYTIVFQPANAFYQGLPYQQEVNTGLETILFSQITVQSVKLGLDSTASQGKFELQQAFQGIPLLVSVRSTSARSEQIIPSLENLPGFSLAETLPISIGPNGETTTILHLIGDKQLKPGKWDGSLILSPQGPIDIVNHRAPVKFDLFTPQITFSVEVISKCSESNCWQWAPVRLILRTVSTSLVAERIDLELAGIVGASLSQKTVEVQPGVGQIDLEIKPVGQFSSRSYEGTISFSNPRHGVDIIPDQALPVSFTVDPFWVSCQKPLIFLGIGLLAVIMIIVMVIKKMRTTSKPPIVTGTLVHWNKDLPDLTTNVDLTALKKTEIHIGKGSSNEVVIPDGTVDEVHALIITEKVEDEVRLVLQPRSKVRKGYREYSDPLSLEENVTYQMGSRVFKYIRDADL